MTVLRCFFVLIGDKEAHCRRDFGGIRYNFDMLTLRRSLPPINALVVFEVAARHQNLTAAGAELCIAASAVSRHVATVERETRLTLFRRSGNRLELTAAGQRLADAIGAGLGHVRDVLSSLKQHESNPTLTIACSHDLAQNWLMPRFRELAERISDRQVRVITATTYEGFDAPDIDISIRFGDGKWPGFRTVHLFDEEGFPICAPELLAKHPELFNAPPQVLMKFPLLRLASEETIGLKWADWLSALGVKLPVVKGTVFSTFSLLLLELVAARGIALGYTHIVDQLFIDGRIVRLSDQSVRTGLGFYLVYREIDRIPLETLIEVCGKGLDPAKGIVGNITADV
jgi:LysR family transcriptional regulator, glycine cleavage system transcriptional activator